jgi:hypothetical protein
MNYETVILASFTMLMSIGYALHEYSIIKKDIPITREMKVGRFIERFAMAVLFMLILSKLNGYSVPKYLVGLSAIGFGFWFHFDLALNQLRGKKWYYTGENSELDDFKSLSPKLINIAIFAIHNVLLLIFVNIK